MSFENDSLSLYRELADRYDKFGQFSMRDRFLVLAADTAYQAGEYDEAEELRQRVLKLSRHHMLRPYSSFAEAMAAPDVQTYLADLRANYPPETAAQLLASIKGGVKAAAVAEPQPIGWTPSATPAPLNIPQTAPLFDPYKPASVPGKPTWQPATPFRVLDEPEEPAPTIPAPPPAPPTRPLAQPLPGRKNPPPTLLDPPVTAPPPATPQVPVKPTAAIPLAAPIPLAPPVKKPAPAPAPRAKP